MALNFERLENIAKALKPLSQTGKSFHVTFAYFGNKLLAIGTNNYDKVHPHYRFGRYVATKTSNHANYQAGIHSETSCIIKLGLEDCSHITFVNIRIDNNGKPAMSKPCFNCRKVLEQQVSYKNVWYYNGTSYQKLS